MKLLFDLFPVILFFATFKYYGSNPEGAAALVGSLLVGVVDTLGRALLPWLLRSFLPGEVAAHLGPALAAILIYVLMAAVLLWRPNGLLGKA